MIYFYEQNFDSINENDAIEAEHFTDEVFLEHTEENNDPRKDWCSFEFRPTETSDREIKPQPHLRTKYTALEEFFSTFSDKINELNLIDRDINTIHELCIALAKNINELNELLINDPNGFTAVQV